MLVQIAVIMHITKNIILCGAAIFVGFMLESCDECSSVSDACDKESLKICDPDSDDLKKYVTRNDSSAVYGMAQAIKSVPESGEIEWIANNFILKLTGDDYYLYIENYADTSWVGLEYWAFQREDILTKLDPFYVGEQSIFSKSTFDQDSTVNYSRYVTNLDDFRDAAWQINEAHDNFITVTYVDHVTEVIEGEFVLHFSMTDQSTLPGVSYSEDVVFRCGRFKAKIFR